MAEKKLTEKEFVGAQELGSNSVYLERAVHVLSRCDDGGVAVGAAEDAKDFEERKWWRRRRVDMSDRNVRVAKRKLIFRRN
nr:hypothetical protein Iba_chr09bCG3430 [Ipomoea batatas]